MVPGEIYPRLVEILKNSPFDIEEELAPQRELKSLKSWDSMKHLLFLLEIEKQFSIEITPEEAANLITVEDLIGKIGK